MRFVTIVFTSLAGVLGLASCGDDPGQPSDAVEAIASSGGISADGGDGDGDANSAAGGAAESSSGGAFAGETGGTSSDGGSEGDSGGSFSAGGSAGDSDEGDGCDGDAMGASGAFTLNVEGTERVYLVSLPEGYDPGSSYPVVFAFHGLGGNGEGASGSFYFGIEQTGGKPSIFVYPDGSPTDGGLGWPNEGGADVAFFDALLVTLKSDYCIDSERVFATGHSYGGIMSHTLACERSDVVRAIAPVAGAHFGRGNCGGAVAAWGAHGDPDETVAYENGLSAIERIMETNGCDSSSAQPAEPIENCEQYSCDDGVPVTWCVHDEGHGWPGFAAASIKAFFDSF